MSEIQQLLGWLHAYTRTTMAKHARDERGATAETVILVAIFAAGAIAIATIIVAKFTSEAESIPTK